MAASSGRSRSPQRGDQPSPVGAGLAQHGEGSAWSRAEAEASYEADQLTQGALIRLADALDTTVPSRHGPRTTPVRGLAAPHPVMEPEHLSGRRIRTW